MYVQRQHSGEQLHLTTTVTRNQEDVGAPLTWPLGSHCELFAQEDTVDLEQTCSSLSEWETKIKCEMLMKYRLQVILDDLTL